MAGEQDAARQAKLDSIRASLMGNPTKDELEVMQLQLDVIEKHDRITANMMEEHHHHHMDDHDDVP